MAEYDDDINALLHFLDANSIVAADRFPEAIRYYRALTALIAERDALKAQVLDLAFKLDGEQENRSALKRRVNELEDEQVESDRDLRERLVCAALTGLIAGNYGSEYDSVAIYAIKHADAVLAAMRKGESNDK